VSLTLSQKPGDKVKVEYVRDGKTYNTTVTLAAQPASSPASPPTTS
jgi:S1-C subfamily serine protease